MLRHILILLLLCVPCWGAGNTYHCTATGAGGHTGADLANAWTLAEAFAPANVAPDDIVLLYDDGGSFGAVKIDNDSSAGGYIVMDVGTSGHPITYRAAPGESPVFTCLNTSNYSTTDSYLSFEGIDFAPVATDTQPTILSTVLLKGGGHFTFTNCTIRRIKTTYNSIGGSAYWFNSSSAYLIPDGATGAPNHHTAFSGCTFYGTGPVSAAPNHHITIDDCTFVDNCGDVIAIGAHETIISDCDFSDGNVRRGVLQNLPGTVTGTFVIGQGVTQDTTGATGIVNGKTGTTYVYFHQTSATNFAANTTIRQDNDPTNIYISGTFIVDGTHPDFIQVNPGILYVSALTEDTPDTKTQITTLTAMNLVTGDEVFLSGFGGTDAADLNQLHFSVTVVDSTHFWIAYDMTGKTLTTTSARCSPVIRDLKIQRNTFHDIGALCNSAIDIFGQTSANTLFDGILIESNLIYSDQLVYGIWLGGLNSRGHGNIKVLNNTAFASYGGGTKGIYLDVSALTSHGSCIIDQMYNNIADMINIEADSGVEVGGVTAHDNNSFAGESDTSGHWTNGASDVTNATMTDYFTNYAGNNYTLKAGSPAIDSGNTSYFSTLDILGVTRDANPDIGAYEYVSGVTPPKLILIRK